MKKPRNESGALVQSRGAGGAAYLVLTTTKSTRRSFSIVAASAFGFIGPITAALLQVAGTLIVVFNSARLVRKGEELEHFHSEAVADTRGPGSPSKPAGEWMPKTA